MSMRAANALRLITKRSFSVNACLASKGNQGSGSGYGGGSGGSIREAGGAFGEREAAQENAYFKKLEREQFEALKKRHEEEISHHEQEIQRHLDIIKRHREQQKSLNKKDGKKDD